MYNEFLDIKKEVREALEQKKPVVALESTIISHGMPYPQNVETAARVEEIVRENGAVPATIAIINGRLKVGLTENEIDFMGKSSDIAKVSRRDFAYIVAAKKNGATTVASTMMIADMAGIRIFATGGIGGVHRGAEKTFDVSADLQELANTNVAVICAGAKSILDLEKTLEYLETYGVPVFGYKTNELPAFYTRKSGLGIDYRFETPKEIAEVLNTKEKLGLKGGVVIANPIDEKYEQDEVKITACIAQALSEAEKNGIKGKDTTPFLLAKVKEITGGDSLTSNIKLVYGNAELAAKIAAECAKGRS